VAVGRDLGKAHSTIEGDRRLHPRQAVEAHTRIAGLLCHRDDRRC